MQLKIKSCLIVTYGPVPTSQYQTVEGGGMRVWGLAKGLLANNVDITIGVNNSFPQAIEEYDGVRLTNWGLDEQFADLINSYDAVIISYCMGDPSVFVADHIKNDVQLILDAYVPIYVEVSARESKNIDQEYAAYASDIAHFNKVLKRGDYFLCANETQKIFYTGVLSSLGILNPRTYREERILIVPFGIHDLPANSSIDPYKKLGIKHDDFKVMWFGGLYPWFHIEELLGAILKLSENNSIKFIFVGGKNPFNPNPDFFQQYEKLVSFSNEHLLKNRTVFFVDWVDFDDRVNWYKHADLVISLNNPGEENKYSWRTRVMDYVWGELAILTNGTDPLSENLIDVNAALRLPELSEKAIILSIQSLYKDRSLLISVQKVVKEIKPNYYWQRLTKPIESVIAGGYLPYSAENVYKNRLGIKNLHQLSTDNQLYRNKLQRIIDITHGLISKARKKGLLNSARLAIGITRTQIKKQRSTNRQRKYIFVSHPINSTGAPIVLLQIVEEYAHKYGAKNVHLITPNIYGDQLRKMRELGVNIDKAVFGIGFRFIRLQLGIRENDFVLMNTVAIYDNYRDFILLWLKTGRLKHVYWFIHEDIAQLPIIHKEFLDEVNIKNVHGLLLKDKLTILTPSKRTRDEYIDLLKAPEDSVKNINLRVDINIPYKKIRNSQEYNSINFLISGTPSDGRKGQLLALSAFYYFIKNHFELSPSDYRDFKIHLVAIGDDYISQQIHWISESFLKNQIVIYPSLAKEKALEVTAKCNAVICCSLNETFGLYVAEGMFMGHLVLRNDSAGIDEQLKEGVNGYFIDHTNIKQFASVIEKVLNKKTSNEKLKTMGIASQRIISEYGKNNYLSQIESIEQDLK